MKKVYVCDDTIMAGYVSGILESHAIGCHLRNASLTGGIGELPINECWPEVWVNDDDDFERASRLINNTLTAAESHKDWQCECGEKIEGQFDTCWACGHVRPVD